MTYRGYSITTKKSEKIYGVWWSNYVISKGQTEVVSAWQNGTHYELKSAAIQAGKDRVDYLISQITED